MKGSSYLLLGISICLGLVVSAIMSYQLSTLDDEDKSYQ